MLRALYVLNSEAYRNIYGPTEQAEIADLVELIGAPQTAQSIHDQPELLAQAEIILSGWGMPKLDADFLAAAPNLKAVFYGAGSIKNIVSDDFWARNIPITSSYAANAVPVAEFTISQILFCLKKGWQHALAIRERGQMVKRLTVPGAYGRTVGVVSLGMIGQLVCRHLLAFELEVIAYDPYVDTAIADDLGVSLCPLDELFRRGDVVTLHTPWLPETEGLITGAHFAQMKPDATFINTARGAIVREAEMIDVLRQRSDLFALLDVTYPEPPAAGSPLYTLPNVVLTPHLAGSRDQECQRMGRVVVDELRRFVHGEPLEWAISREHAAIMA
ncbi:MAG: hydroxyacid dehydrogenase [Caldilineaceae bacterium]|nr:hydroxyacid dehydrogenase [Caldilineaceae bacterium]